MNQRGGEERDRRCRSPPLVSDGHLDQPARQQDEDEIRPDRRRGDAAGERVEDPAQLLCTPCADSAPARWRQTPGRMQRNGRNRGAGAGRGTEDPERWVACEEDRGEREDEHHPRRDEADPADDRAGDSAQPPRAEDRELCRRRTRKQAGCRDAVLEFLGVKPVSLLHAQPAQQRDVRRRATEPDAPETQPLTSDRGERHPAGHSRTVALEHVAQLMESRRRTLARLFLSRGAERRLLPRRPGSLSILRVDRPLQGLENVAEVLRHRGVAGVGVVGRDCRDDRLVLPQ